MMIPAAKDWLASPNKKVLLFGMSGLGKTHVSNMLRATGAWFHYSIDYRIGTRYMGEHIVDNFKFHAMKDPFLAELLRSDSIYIGSNITFNNLAPLSTYLGKPGNPDLGGLPCKEYRRRQDLHRTAEINALQDTPHFINRAKALYGYPNFVCDTGGSICEVVDPWDENDPVLKSLAENTLMVWIQGSEAHTDALISRFDKSPKPMYYQPEFLERVWSEYLSDNKLQEGEVNPDDFVRSAYARALEARQPRYAAMAENWGVSVCAEDVAQSTTPDAFVALIGKALEKRAKAA
ncbi:MULTISPECIES: ATPase [Halocynthiibacter]|uniref:ATPase n=1 Tax=Halocynthiibacter halioticoli TaxID=2986804 RepID=A0AAE3LRE6_9RHOB|nr:MULTISPECIES: ATPase [Halocynthiibacter]MCV6824414.1 ATPase [Halocynthiibacter halioticoli]MCW4057415.1 ATPase [Halocynthiibacter sp. SDUM655004]